MTLAGVVFARIRSWHLVVHAYGVPTSTTACGRTLREDAPRSETLPAEKSCETCLRALAREDAR